MPSWLQTTIADALQHGRGLAVGKIGTCEADMLYVHLHGHPYNGPLRVALCRNGGVWPEENRTLTAWARYMQTNALPAMDGVVIWYNDAQEREIVETWAPQAVQLAGLETLDPLRGDCWTRLFTPGMTVAVVTPFAESVTQQVGRLTEVFPDPNISPWSSPPPRFVAVRTGCSPSLDSEGAAAWPTDLLRGGWRSAVTSIVDQVTASGARAALVGCGALSLPVVAALKERGIIAVHTGGATQLLFGIGGQRWESDTVIQALQTPAWCVPLPVETPKGYKKIEGGCYWSREPAVPPCPLPQL